MAGIGPLVLVALLVAIVGGWYGWARQRGLVSAAPAGQPAPRISLLTEAVGYVGTILILAGVISAVGQRWEHLSAWGHVGVLAAAGGFFLVVGLLVRGAAEPALQRLASVAWMLSVGGLAASVGVGVAEVGDRTGEPVLLAVGLSATAVAAVLWLVRQRALQLFAVFVGVVMTTAGLVLIPPGDPDRAVLALALWAVGLGWTVAAWRGVLEPLWAGLALGALLALVAPCIGIDEHGWMYVVAIGTSAAAMAISVRLENTPLLALGTVTSFAYVTWMVVRYFGDSLGVPATLAVTGVLVLLLALVSARLMRSYREPTVDARPRDTDDEVLQVGGSHRRRHPVGR